MNTKLTTTYLLVGALLAPVAGYTANTSTKESTTKKESVGQSIDDAAITTILKAELERIGVSNIDVKTIDRVVRLYGSVKSEQVRDKVVSIARSVRGVTWVEYDIKVKSQPG